MRILIQGEGHNLNLVLPTRMLFSKTVLKLVNRTGRKYAGEALEKIPPEALDAIFAELRRVKDQYGSWDLVDMESADGKKIWIRL